MDNQTGGRAIAPLMDRLLSHPYLYNMIKDESVRQVRKRGIQERTAFEWMTFLTEEVGETAQAISEWAYGDGLQSAVVKEAIQAATLSLKIAEMFIEVK